MSDRFISHMLARNIRIEEDLIDQLFNSSEKRLARTLLLLARYGKQDKPVRVVPKISQETLAEMVGTTRSRVNFFLNKFNWSEREESVHEIIEELEEKTRGIGAVVEFFEPPAVPGYGSSDGFSLRMLDKSSTWSTTMSSTR